MSSELIFWLVDLEHSKSSFLIQLRQQEKLRVSGVGQMKESFTEAAS